MTTEIEAYIRRAAAARGINPDIAVRVAKSEGGLSNPIQQSYVKKNGLREPSYGPFQLLVGGGNTGFPEGMGNRFVQSTGMHPSDPAAAYKGIDFALDQAKQDGWSQWYGAKASGIGRYDGIGGAPSGEMPTAPAPAMGITDGPKGQETYQPPVLGSMAPSSQVASSATSTSAAPPPSLAADPRANIFGMMMASNPQPVQFSPVQIQGPSAEQANGLLNLLTALKQRMA